MAFRNADRSTCNDTVDSITGNYCNEMSIAFDAFSQYDEATPRTTITNPHTCAGANRFLYVHILTSESSGADIITSMTYNGVTMTRLNSILAATSQRTYFYYLIAPATGTNNIVTTTTVNSQPSIRGSSFTGTNQTSFPDASSSNTATGGANLVLTVTTVADNCWILAGARSNSTAFTAGASTTIRTTAAINDVTADSNAARTPAGSQSLTLVTGGSSNSGGIVASLAPAAAAPTGNRNTGFFMFG